MITRLYDRFEKIPLVGTFLKLVGVSFQRSLIEILEAGREMCAAWRKFCLDMKDIGRQIKSDISRD